MTDPMEDLINKIKDTIRKLRNWINDKDRDDLEFDINDLNVNIWWMEYDCDCRCIDLDFERDKEYNREKNNIKTDAAIKRHLDSKFIEKANSIKKIEAHLKRYKRLHSWFIRIAEHIKSNIIKEQADMKRNWF